MESFKALENEPAGSRHAWADVREQLRFNEAGLLPAVAQQSGTGEALMPAWMSRSTLDETLATGRVCYWSRSRGAPWRKGESSGQIQRLVEARIDCDGDAVLLLVDQQGPACHTGRRSCFFHEIDGDETVIAADPVTDPTILYGDER